MNENNYIVYKHTSPSGKVYIGITKQSIKQRWRCGKGYKHCIIFLQAINKYGWDNIKHEILLQNQDADSAKYSEKYLIKWYKSHNISYNVTDGGEGSLGKPMLDSTKEKISIKVRNYYKTHQSPWVGRNHKKETKEILSLKAKERYENKENHPRYGTHLSEEAKEKLSKYFKGKPSPAKGKKRSGEFCRKMSEAKKGKAPAMSREKVLLGAKNAREKLIKKVYQFDLEGNYIQTFNSITDACFFLGKGRQTTSICAACSGKQKTAFGYIWKYNI